MHFRAPYLQRSLGAAGSFFAGLFFLSVRFMPLFGKEFIQILNCSFEEAEDELGKFEIQI